MRCGEIITGAFAEREEFFRHTHAYGVRTLVAIVSPAMTVAVITRHRRSATTFQIATEDIFLRHMQFLISLFQHATVM